MFLNFLQEGHFQMYRSADLDSEQEMRFISVEQEQVIEVFSMSRLCRKERAESSVAVRWCISSCILGCTGCKGISVNEDIVQLPFDCGFYMGWQYWEQTIFSAISVCHESELMMSIIISWRCSLRVHLYRTVFTSCSLRLWLLYGTTVLRANDF